MIQYISKIRFGLSPFMVLSLCIGLILLPSHLNAQSRDQKVNLYVQNLFAITEIMVSDVTPPTGASRFYAYSTLGAYAAMVGEQGIKHSFINEFNQPLNINYPDPVEIDSTFSAIYCMLEVGKGIMPSGKLLGKTQEELFQKFKTNRWTNKKILENSIAYAQEIAQQILTYSKSDGYGQLSALPRYTPANKPGTWYPTPPAYLMAIDPEWKTIRTFYIKDLERFKPVPPAPFSMEKNSAFYKQVKEVYDTTRVLNQEKRLIANFWDCNPFMVSYSGHMAIGLKKISPGGHWVNITGIASKKAKLSFFQAVEVHAMVSLGLHDAFISCWEEKYDSDRIRPETVINRHLDQNWRPILQTPPFPEYTSGHSVISRTSAVLLTSYFGENFSYTDTSEEYFGLPARKFKSFLQASDEAAISRLYGGIHYRDAIEVGINQGNKIAHHILGRIKPQGTLSQK
ncbi:vanadium-dependent haloperoxidase [Echinicola marina]|uniref:vanadium-dependent haloperoxidase n=1 Tax=Echinicola marina TaxID=2859768 RepID=UPI001CF7090A|nr:vanadium-dependent haloperoxidase [Echinicola marina]UCS93085.1 vanadium-dependent haloperoxidase [Echinicola marina]